MTPAAQQHLENIMTRAFTGRRGSAFRAMNLAKRIVRTGLAARSDVSEAMLVAQARAMYSVNGVRGMQQASR